MTLCACNYCVQEYKEDMSAAGLSECTCSMAWFCHVFRTDQRVAHITVASGKENFGRCSECSAFADDLRVAIRNGDAKEVGSIKRKRLVHYLLERADKLSYYNNRCRGTYNGMHAHSHFM